MVMGTFSWRTSLELSWGPWHHRDLRVFLTENFLCAKLCAFPSCRHLSHLLSVLLTIYCASTSPEDVITQQVLNQEVLRAWLTVHLTHPPGGTVAWHQGNILSGKDWGATFQVMSPPALCLCEWSYGTPDALLELSQLKTRLGCLTIIQQLLVIDKHLVNEEAAKWDLLVGRVRKNPGYRVDQN